MNNGTCTDKLNAYECLCSANYTGEKCETQANYCSIHQPCKNNATCIALGDTDFNCTCKPGFAGKSCDELTTINYNGSGFWELEVSKLSNDFEVSLSFRTILLDSRMILQLKGSDTQLDVYVKNGNLVAKYMDVTTFVLGRQFNDDLWHRLRIIYRNKKLNFSVDNSSLVTVFDTLKTELLADVTDVSIGGLRNHANNPIKDFTGCIRDVVISGTAYSPGRTGKKSSELQVGACMRNVSCTADSCSGHGACVDKWTSLSCQCERQFYGDQCETG